MDAPLLKPGVLNFLNFTHFDGYVAVLDCSFDLHLPDGQR